MTAGDDRNLRFNDQLTVGIKRSAKGVLARLVPRRRVLWCRRGVGYRRVAMTFDDGPDPHVTPRLLECLEQAGVRATFFLIGERVRGNEDLVRSIDDGGHQLGIHGFDHRSIRDLPAGELVDDVQRSEAAIGSVIGKRVTVYRPPLGEYRLRQLPVLWGLGKTVVLWSIDSRDFALATGGAVLSNVRIERLVGGDVLLFHDRFPHTVDAVAGLVQSMRDRGLEPVTVNEMIHGP